MHLIKKTDIDKQKYILTGGSVAMALILIFISYNALKPTIKDLGVTSKKIKKGEVIAPDVAKYQEEYGNLEIRIKKLKQEIENSRERLFWKKDISVFLEKLTHIAEQLSVDFISIKPGIGPSPIMSEGANGEQGRAMVKSFVNIKMRTGYRELIDFLGRVESSDKYLRIDKINIASGTKDTSRRDIAISLSLFSAE